MTPIEDRLNEYLSQFDGEPEMALSLRRSAYLDRQLAQAGIVPAKTIELPTNITPTLLNTLLGNWKLLADFPETAGKSLSQGDNPMSTQSPPFPNRVRIHSHVTKSKFLHVEDALNMGKIRLFAGNYRRGDGMNSHAYHFVDLADARVIFSALARGEQSFTHKEYKGTPPRNGSGAVSRTLSVAIKGDNVYIELKTGPGKLTNTGAITPNGPAKAEVNVGFKLHEARRMAASVLAYIHAWDVMRMMYHHGVMGNQHLVGQPAPYLLVSTTSEANGAKTTPANGAPKANGTTKPPVAAANNGRPVTRKTAQPAATNQVAPSVIANSLPPRRRGGRSQNGHGKQNGNGSQPQVLLYGNGTPVAADNQTERTAYARYQQAKGAAPPSKSALQQFYQQQMVAREG